MPAGTGLDLATLAFDDLGPERIFHYYDPQLDFRSVVVIDTRRFGISAGGVRMASDLTLAEVARLARAMSYKFALLELRCGGAKGGIWYDPTHLHRAEIVRSFLDAIEPLTWNAAYMPGADMGTTAADFAAVYAARGGQDLGQQEFEGLPLEDQVTGYGVTIAAQTAAELLGWKAPASVAIEGFGKVGAGASKYFVRHGARVVAVSTIHQTLYDARGLDVGALLALRQAHGDAALDHYPTGERHPRAALLTLPVDILVPGARPDAICADNVDAIRARLIVPAANIPYADGTIPRLAARGVVAIPDFVANAGGVLTGMVALQRGAVDQLFTTVRERIGANVRRIMTLAEQRGCGPYEAALDLAEQWWRSGD